MNGLYLERAEPQRSQCLGGGGEGGQQLRVHEAQRHYRPRLAQRVLHLLHLRVRQVSPALHRILLLLFINNYL